MDSFESEKKGMADILQSIVAAVRAGDRELVWILACQLREIDDTIRAQKRLM